MITIITAMWGRYKYVRLAQEHLSQFDPPRVIAGSEGWMSAEIAKDTGAEYIETKNQPLGRKFNAALSMARELEPDGVLVLGSDNICGIEMIEAWDRAIEAGWDLCGITDSTQWIPHKGLFYWPGYGENCNAKREGETAGSGRCYSRKLLEACDWQLWDPDLTMSLDYSATLTAQAHQARVYAIKMDDAAIHHTGVKVESMSPQPSNAVQIARGNLELWYGDTGKKLLGLK